MPNTHSERLSATDALFLEIEDASVNMTVAACAIFESEPLRGEDGRLDVARLRTFIDRALFESPRCRQKLAWSPTFDHPAWVDDERFNLEYHVRHTALPPPGDLRQLKRLTGRILSQKLDRTKPLWEMWIVERLEDGRFAMILKAHHCMVDGIAGMDLVGALLRLEPDATMPPSRTFYPRPEPPPSKLRSDEIAHRAALPISVLRSAPASLLRPDRLLRTASESVLALSETIAAGLSPTMKTPFNQTLGPYRRFDWTTTDFGRISEVRKHLGGTLNDVVLATVSGAVGRFFARRGRRPEPADVFRTMVPVSIRRQNEQGTPGNRVVNFMARLPIDERDPRRRLERTIETTRKLKRSRLVKGAEIIEEFANQTFDTLVVELVQLSANARAYNMVVTNVPGPPRPLYMLGARMTDIYPVVPLFSGQCVGIALFSYDGKLCWGFTGDWDALPDLHDFVGDVEAAFDELHAAAEEASRSETVG